MATALHGSDYCANCRRRVRVSKPGVDNLVHSLVTLFLCGLWLPVWIFILAANEAAPYRCDRCGSRV